MPSMTSERARAFDQAFSHEPLPDRKVGALAELMGQLMPYYPGVPEMMRMEDGHLVSEEYCGICHRDAPCKHTDALNILVLEREWAEEQAEARAVAVGVG